MQATGTVAGLGVLGTVSAEKPSPVSAEKAGVRNGVTQLLRENKIEQAERLLDQHNVRYVSDRKEVGPEVTPDGRYSESNSEIYKSLVDYGGDDEWLATGVMTLSERRTRIRDAAVIEDACGITYDSTEWTSVDPSDDNLWLSCTSDATGSCSISKEEYDPNLGAAAAVDLPYTMNDDTTVNMQTVLTRNDSTGNDDIPVKFEYEHTWTYLDQPWNISIGVSFGGLEVSLSGEASVAWDDHITAEPGEYSGPE